MKQNLTKLCAELVDFGTQIQNSSQIHAQQVANAKNLLETLTSAPQLTSGQVSRVNFTLWTICHTFLKNGQFHEFATFLTYTRIVGQFVQEKRYENYSKWYNLTLNCFQTICRRKVLNEWKSAATIIVKNVLTFQLESVTTARQCAAVHSMYVMFNCLSSQTTAGGIVEWLRVMQTHLESLNGFHMAKDNAELLTYSYCLKINKYAVDTIKDPPDLLEWTRVFARFLTKLFPNDFVYNHFLIHRTVYKLLVDPGYNYKAVVSKCLNVTSPNKMAFFNTYYLLQTCQHIIQLRKPPDTVNVKLLEFTRAVAHAAVRSYDVTYKTAAHEQFNVAMVRDCQCKRSRCTGSGFIELCACVFKSMLQALYYTDAITSLHDDIFGMFRQIIDMCGECEFLAKYRMDCYDSYIKVGTKVQTMTPSIMEECSQFIFEQINKNHERDKYLKYFCRICGVIKDAITQRVYIACAIIYDVQYLWELYLYSYLVEKPERPFSVIDVIEQHNDHIKRVNPYFNVNDDLMLKELDAFVDKNPALCEYLSSKIVRIFDKFDLHAQLWFLVVCYKHTFVIKAIRSDLIAIVDVLLRKLPRADGKSVYASFLLLFKHHAMETTETPIVPSSLLSLHPKLDIKIGDITPISLTFVEQALVHIKSVAAHALTHVARVHLFFFTLESMADTLRMHDRLFDCMEVLRDCTSHFDVSTFNCQCEDVAIRRLSFTNFVRNDVDENDCHYLVMFYYLKMTAHLVEWINLSTDNRHVTNFEKIFQNPHVQNDTELEKIHVMYKINRGLNHFQTGNYPKCFDELHSASKHTIKDMVIEQKLACLRVKCMSLPCHYRVDNHQTLIGRLFSLHQNILSVLRYYKSSNKSLLCLYLDQVVFIVNEYTRFGLIREASAFVHCAIETATNQTAPIRIAHLLALNLTVLDRMNNVETMTANLEKITEIAKTEWKKSGELARFDRNHVTLFACVLTYKFVCGSVDFEQCDKRLRKMIEKMAGLNRGCVNLCEIFSRELCVCYSRVVNHHIERLISERAFTKAHSIAVKAIELIRAGDFGHLKYFSRLFFHELALRDLK